MVDWTYDEIVLLCNAVVANDWKEIRATSREAMALSALLQRGQLHPPQKLPDSFRNLNSIQRKSADLVSAAPGYMGKPTRGGRLTAVVARAFDEDPEAMHEKAQAILDLISSDRLPDLSVPRDADEMLSAEEGGIIELTARRRERDPKLRQQKLKSVIDAGRPVACEVCAFDFQTTYGERGAGYIEVHHIRPLHVSGSTRTHLDDLALVCANCHRMCHHGGWITPAQLAKFLTTSD